MGAFGELFVHIVRSIFRRKDCPTDYHNVIEIFVYDLLEELAGKPHFYPPVNWLRENKIRGQKIIFLRDLQKHAAVLIVHVKHVQLLFVCFTLQRYLCLILDKSVSECVPLESAKEENNNISLDSIKSSSRTSSK